MEPAAGPPDPPGGGALEHDAAHGEVCPGGPGRDPEPEPDGWKFGVARAAPDLYPGLRAGAPRWATLG